MTLTESTQQMARERALNALADLGGRTTTEDDIVFQGKKLVVPETFRDLEEVERFIAQRRQDEEQDYGFTRTFKYRPEDGAVATGRAIKKAFGMSIGKPIVSFFGSSPPELRDVEVGLNRTEQAPFGLVEVPGLAGMTIHIGHADDAELGRVFRLSAQGPRKWRFHVEGLFQLVEEELRTNSIYRGQAIDGSAKPNFIDLSAVDPNGVIYSQSVLTQLGANVWTPIEHAEELSKRGHSGKRAVLFEGPYGTGKTLAAYLTGQRAINHGWTFLLVRPGKDNLEQAIQTARMYQPAVIFTEDIDTVGSAGSGDADHMSRILDLFDGIESKGLRMLLVLTTNEVQKLHPAMLRPGRLDAVISVRDLDQDGIERLSRYVLEDRLDGNIDWGRVHQACEGYTPAYIHELIKRTDTYAVARGDMNYRVTTDDLVDAAEGLRPQWKLMRSANPEPETNLLGRGIAEVVREHVPPAIQGIEIRDKDGDRIGEYGMFVGGPAADNGSE